MIRANRREAMMGALAVPTLAGLPQWRWRHGEASVLLYDGGLAAGRRFAAAGQDRGGQVVELSGDRIRLAQGIAEARPALVAGISLAADAVLVEDVLRERGYARVALFSGAAAACTLHECAPGWQALARLAESAGGGWVEALAAYAARQGKDGIELPATAVGDEDASVLGWILAPRA